MEIYFTKETSLLISAPALSKLKGCIPRYLLAKAYFNDLIMLIKIATDIKNTLIKILTYRSIF